MNAAQLLVAQLVVNKVERVFCVPGESYLAVLDALLDAPEIDVVTCRQEGGAAMMAEAHGKLTGRPGVAFVTRGPGATNASAGVHVAHQDGTPMILFVGHVGRFMVGRGAFQEVDYRSMFASLTKWTDVVDDGDRIPELVGRAFHTACSGRPGPVVLALPEDMLTTTVDARPAGPPVPVRTGMAAEDATATAALLAEARRPILILGGGGWSDAAARDAACFAARQALPTIVAFRCQDYIDNDDRHYIGNLGLGTNPALVRAVQEADLIIAVGARLGEVTSGGYTLIDLPQPAQKLVHIVPDPSELGRIYRPDVAVVASASAALATLASLPDSGRDPARAAALRESYLLWSRLPEIPGSLQMGAILGHLRECLPRDAIVTNGAGNFAIWPNRYYRYRHYRSMLAPMSGSMGYGVPAAIAAKLLDPARPVIAFTGDGDFLMTGQELATAAQHGADIVVLLVNNGSFGTIRMHQEREYPGRVSATDLANPDFVKLAEAYGAHAARVLRTEEFAPAFAAALNVGRLAVIELVLDKEAITPTKTISGLRRAEG